MNMGIEKPNSGHICEKYQRALHLAISTCIRDIRIVLKQIAVARKASRSEEIASLQINGKTAKPEDIIWAADIFHNRRQIPSFDQNLWEKNNSAIKRSIVETEKFLQNIQKRLEGVKIPKRPREVDEWMER